MSKNKILNFALFFSLIFLAAACNQKRAPVYYNDGTIELRNNTVKIELAQDGPKRALGLGGRQSIDEDEGMLFVFNSPDYHTFWMKDMNFPIDILWLKDDHVVDMVINAEPEPLKPDKDLKTYKPIQKANKVLELKAGWIIRFGVKFGDQVKINLKK